MMGNNKLEQSIYRLFEITPIPIILSSPSGQLEYVNPALNNMLGYQGQEIFANEVIITYGLDAEKNQAIRQALNTHPETPIKVEKRYLHKHGHIIHAQLNIVAQTDADGNIIRYISQIIDLTSFKQSEAGEVILNHLVNQSSDAIYIIDPHCGQLLNCNHLGYRRLGYSKQELLTLSVRHLHPHFNVERKWQLHVGNIKHHGSKIIESTHTRKDGTEFPVEANVSYITFNETDYLFAIVRDISRRKQHELEALNRSNLDPLTKLPNRGVMEQRLAELFASAEQRDLFIAFIYIDLDQFKAINDTYGHTIGDDVLIGTANRLKNTIRKTDIITRLGGDEFLIIVHDLASEKQVKLLAENLVNQFQHPFMVQNHQLKIEASIGVTIYFGNNTDGKTLIQLADEAMYQAKKRSGTSIYYL